MQIVDVIPVVNYAVAARRSATEDRKSGERNTLVRSGDPHSYSRSERAEPAAAGSIQLDRDLFIIFSGMGIFKEW